MKKQLFGFTLVELIVVITIVGILSTVGFVSYSGYLAGARDSNRFSQLTKLSDSLQVYAATKSLPPPDDYIEVTASGTVIAYQGYVGVDVLETIDYTNGGKDPKDGGYYTYYVTKARNSMQLLAFMEEQSSVTNISQSYAADYTERVPKVYGKKLGVLTEITSNTPIQEVSGLTTLDIVTTTDVYISHLSDSIKLEGTGATLQASIPNGSCKRIKQMGKSKGNGKYTINPNGNGEFQVYCDMETKGGGWTYLLSATANGTKFGNAAPVWETPVYDTISSQIYSDVEFQSEAYGTVETNDIMLCYQDSEHCYVFDHNLGITLQSFYTDDISYTKYSSGSAGYSDMGAVSDMTAYETALGSIVMDKKACQWLGINYNRNGGLSAIGLLADSDSGCTSSSHDNAAYGLGLNSCGDNSGCGIAFNAGNKSGQQYEISGGELIIGSWFVLGR